MERQLLHPQLTQRVNSSLHFHLSVPNRDLTSIAALLNDRMLLRLVAGGDLTDLTSFGISQFSSDLSLKGLVRLVSRNRIEVRVHQESLQSELRELMSLLSLPEDQAKQTLQNQIQSLLSENTISRLGRFNSATLEHFVPYMNPEQKTAALRQGLARRAIAKELASRPNWSTKDWQKAIEVFKSDDFSTGSILLSSIPERVPATFWEAYPDLIRTHPQIAERISLKIGKAWKGESIDKIVATIDASSPERAGAVTGLFMQGDLRNPNPAETARTLAWITALMEPPRNATAIAQLKAIGAARWPESVWNTLLRDPRAERSPAFRQALVTLIAGSYYPPPDSIQWVRRFLSKNLESQPVDVVEDAFQIWAVHNRHLASDQDRTIVKALNALPLSEHSKDMIFSYYVADPQLASEMETLAIRRLKSRSPTSVVATLGELLRPEHQSQDSRPFSIPLITEIQRLSEEGNQVAIRFLSQHPRIPASERALPELILSCESAFARLPSFEPAQRSILLGP